MARTIILGWVGLLGWFILPGGYPCRVGFPSGLEYATYLAKGAHARAPLIAEGGRKNPTQKRRVADVRKPHRLGVAVGSLNITYGAR